MKKLLYLLLSVLVSFQLEAQTTKTFGQLPGASIVSTSDSVIIHRYPSGYYRTSLSRLLVPDNLGTGTGTSTKVLYGDGVWRVPMSLSSLSATTPLSYNTGTGAFSIQQAGISQDGYLSTSDWNSFNNKVGLSSFSAASPLSYNSGTGVFSIPLAATSQNGYLSSTDWNTFNNKVPTTTTVNGHALSSNVTVAPSDLTTDASHRFVTDGQITTWNACPADNTVVHLTGNETVAGVKTFSSSPSVPSPSGANDALNLSFGNSNYKSLKSIIGTVLTENWATLSNWASVGSPVASVSGGNLTISGTNSLSTNYIKNTSYGITNAEYSLSEWSINVNTIGAGTSGKPFGFQGQSGSAFNALKVNLELSSTNTGKINWYGDNGTTAIQTSDGTLGGLASGHIVSCKLYRYPNRYLFIAIDNNTGNSVQDVLYLALPRTSLTTINPVLAGQLAFFNWGGSHTIGQFKYTLLDQKAIDLLLIGDSITQLQGSPYRAITKISERFEATVECNAQPSAVCGDINVSEAALYTATNVLLFIGTNDVANSGVSTAQTNYSNLVTALAGIGYSTTNGNLKFATLLPRGSSIYNTFNTWLISTYGISNVIDLNSVLSDGSVSLPTKYTNDAIHPNPMGSLLIADRIATSYGYKRRDHFNSPLIPLFSSAYNGYTAMGINSPTSNPRYGIDLSDINKNTIARIGGTYTDNGNYIIHDNTNHLGLISHGATMESSVWTAKDNSAVAYGQYLAGRFGIYTDNSLTAGSTYTPSLRFIISPGGFITTGTTGVFNYRNTNGGTTLSAHLLVDPANSITTGIAYTFDATNGLGFTTGNGTLRVLFAAIKPIATNSTAGSEAGDVAIYTQSGGTAATEKLRITSAGNITVPTTITAAGTTGVQTINKVSGTVNIAAGQTSITVTNSLVTVNSIVLPVIRANDSTAQIKNVVPSAGSFTINLVSPTAETSLGFFVIN